MYRDGTIKDTEKGRDESTTRLPTEKSWQRKTRRLLYIFCLTMQQTQSSLLVFLYHNFCSRLVFLCFHPCLVYVHFTGPFLLAVNVLQKYLPLVISSIHVRILIRQNIISSHSLITRRKGKRITTTYSERRITQKLTNHFTI